MFPCLFLHPHKVFRDMRVVKTDCHRKFRTDAEALHVFPQGGMWRALDQPQWQQFLQQQKKKKQQQLEFRRRAKSMEHRHAMRTVNRVHLLPRSRAR